MHLKNCDPRIGTILFNPLDDNAGRALDTYGEWGRDEMDLLGQVLRPGDRAIDVGSHVGTLSVALARVVGAQGAVYAIDASRAALQLTAANVAINGLSNVHTILAAASNEDGKELVVPPVDTDSRGCHGCIALDPSNFIGERVSTITIDSLQLPTCRMIKVDVEGMELEVLQGARNTILASKPAMYIRVHYDKRDNSLSLNTQRAARFLQSLNYDMYWHFSRRFFEDNFFRNKSDIYEGEQDLFMLAVPHVDGSKIDGLEQVVVPPE